MKEDVNRFVCNRCGKVYTKQRANFSPSYSPLYHGNGGYLSTCVYCVDDLFLHYRNVLDSDAEAMRRLCMKYDVYWSPKVYAMVSKANTSVSRFRSYLSKLNLGSYNQRSFDDTLDDEAKAASELTEAAAEERAEEVRQAKAEVAEIAARVTEQNKQVNDLNKQIAERNKQIEAQQKQMEGLNKQLETKQQQLATKQQQIDAKQMQIEMKQQLVDAKQQQLKEAQEAISLARAQAKTSVAAAEEAARVAIAEAEARARAMIEEAEARANQTVSLPPTQINPDTGEVIILDEYPMPDAATVRFWGSGYTPENYYNLQERYANWTKDLPKPIDMGAEALYKQLCLLEEIINRDTIAGKPVEKSIATYNNLLGSLNEKPVQKKQEEQLDTDFEEMPFGVGIKLFEDRRPIPHPLPEYQDVDGLIRYITIWFNLIDHVHRKVFAKILTELLETPKANLATTYG